MTIDKSSLSPADGQPSDTISRERRHYLTARAKSLTVEFDEQELWFLADRIMNEALDMDPELFMEDA